MDLSHTTWRSREVVEGGEKWSLIDTSTELSLATVVRLPGTLARVYWRASISPRMQDYASIPEARNAVERHLAAL